MLPLVVRNVRGDRNGSKGACGQARGASRRRPALRAGCPAMLGLAAPAPNSLRSLRSLRSDSVAESEDNSRCARGRKPCASRRLRGAPRACPHAPLLLHQWVGSSRTPLPIQRIRFVHRSGLAKSMRLVEQALLAHTAPSRQAVPGGGDFWGEEQRRAGLGARSALGCLTRRRCLSAVSAANVASSAPRARTEQRTAVGAQRRPPQHEPLPGTACRDARSPGPDDQTRTSAQGRKPTSDNQHAKTD